MSQDFLDIQLTVQIQCKICTCFILNFYRGHPLHDLIFTITKLITGMLYLME